MELARNAADSALLNDIRCRRYRASRAVSPMARPGWHVRAHGPGCALGWQVAQDTVRVRLSWARGSHGPLSPAGLASNVGLAVSAGCPAAVWVVLFSARAAVGGDCSAWRCRARRAQVWPARSGHRWVLEGGVVRMVTRGRLRAAVLLALAGLAWSAISCAAPRVADGVAGPGPHRG